MTGILRRVLLKLPRLWFMARFGRSFGQLGKKSYIVSPFRADCPERMEIGAETFIQRGAWLYADGSRTGAVVLRIGDGCVFGYNNHITAIQEVRIGARVLTANNVYISDNIHSYEDTAIPIMCQPVKFKGQVRIGDGCWIGENACVIGASVGRNSVIGANSVVTKDIPEYSVAVGAPARVIRRFDATTGTWASQPAERRSPE